MDSFGLDSENKQETPSEVTEAVQSQDENMDQNKISEDVMDSSINADSPAVLLGEISDGNIGLKDELDDLKNIGSKGHDISNELKEMFEEKSSDIDELADSTLAKHSLDSDITKEDKLKDIVPDDILGKDDSLDGIGNETLNQESLTCEQPSETVADCLPDEIVLEQDSGTKDENVLENDSTTKNEERDLEQNESDQVGEIELAKHEDSLNYNVPHNIGTKEIDEIIDQGMASDEDHVDKNLSILAEASSVSELGDDLENQLKHITGDGGETSVEDVVERDIINPIDKSSTIELNRENMMVEFAQDDSSGNQVLIQINTDKKEHPTKEPSNSEGLVMKTSDGQTLVLTTENINSENPAADVESQVEGGADFIEAVTGKLEDVLKDTEKELNPREEVNPVTPSIPNSQEEAVPNVKDDPPQCCVSNCKSGKSKLKTPFKFFPPPNNRMLYKKWEYVFNQAKQTLTPDSLICELHFRTGLIYKKGTDKSGKAIWALRDAALPKLSQSGIIRLPSPNSKSPMSVTKKPDSAVSSPTIKSQVVCSPTIKSQVAVILNAHKEEIAQLAQQNGRVQNKLRTEKVKVEIQ